MGLPLSTSVDPLVVFGVIILPIPLLPVETAHSPHLVSGRVSLGDIYPKGSLRELSAMEASFPLAGLNSERVHV